jgi:uncharacterized protein YbbK (DUF523 family)
MCTIMWVNGYHGIEKKTVRVEMHATGHTELFCQEVAAGLQAPRLG